MSAQAPTLKGSAGLFSFKGIRVYVHWTFLILVAWVVINGAMSGMSMAAIAARMGMVLLVFCCVVLHEFGHALTALRYGVRTRDITLLPIGGMASLERMPEEPHQEFWITVAGPAVNLAIAALTFLAITLIGVNESFTDVLLGATTWTQLLVFLFFINAMLFLFNLVPAFPMDGGRILRSLLSMFIPRDRATRVASSIGRLFAIAFVLIGLFNGAPMLALIGVFIFFAAGAELQMVQQQTALRGVKVSEVMRTRFWTMPHSATVRQAVDELLAGGDSDLLVMEHDRYRGVLTRKHLIKALSDQMQEAELGDLEVLKVPAVRPGDDANKALMGLMSGRYPVMPVIEEEQLLGVLEPENLTEFMLVREATGGAGQQA